METKLKILLIIYILSGSLLLSQQSRLDALGGLSYSIVDIDSQIDPFILGGNPAWLAVSQKYQRLEIDPVFKNSKGDYHRYYESGDIDIFNIGFMGIKPLGSRGTFRGSAAYNYMMQKNRNKILTLTPYSGDAFFFTDTTSGDYRYSGPTFDLMYSLEVMENLYIGASINYQILDGLKKVYTYAETLYRNVSGNIGIGYKFSNLISIGLNYEIYDTQERITSSDVNNSTVQTFLYRGDTHKIELRGSSQSYKLKKNGDLFSAQVQLIPIENIVIGLDLKYILHNSESLFPESAIIDVEDGYTSYDNISLVLQARWIQSNNLTIGFTAGYRENNSWSKNSKRDLTIWELGINDLFSGIGLTFSNQKKDFLIGAEYELHSIASDSIKYIDNKYITTEALNHVTRVGLEKSISEMFSIRIGYNLIFKEYDYIFGGNDVTSHFITLGAKIKLSDSMEIEPRLEYATTNLNENDLYKNNFGFYATFRFYNF